MKTTFNNIESLQKMQGKLLGKSDWLLISQEQINNFGQATQDMQWIHVDTEKAQAESPFGTTIAHGFLCLSLIPHLMQNVFEVKGIKMGINYGLNRVRFINIVPANSEICLEISLTKLEQTKEKTFKAFWHCVVLIKGEEKPACIAEMISLFVAL